MNEESKRTFSYPFSIYFPSSYSSSSFSQNEERERRRENTFSHVLSNRFEEEFDGRKDKKTDESNRICLPNLSNDPPSFFHHQIPSFNEGENLFNCKKKATFNFFFFFFLSLHLLKGKGFLEERREKESVLRIESLLNPTCSSETDTIVTTF